MLTIESFPVTTPLLGVIELPGDKSISHRALFFGAIAEGRTIVRGFLSADDCLATLRIFQCLGVVIKQDNTTLMIDGVGLHGLTGADAPLACGNSGTTMRLLMGLLAAQSFDSELVGDTSLQRRPMARVSLPLNQMGAKIITTHEGCAPIQIKKNRTLSGMVYTLPFASAQLKSALLLAGLYCSSPLTLYEQAQTRDHTERLFAWFGRPLNTEVIQAKFKENKYGYTVIPGQSLSARAIDIPGDFSSAAFFIVAATLVEGSDLILKQVGCNPSRLGLLYILKSMGADIEFIEKREFSGEPVADIRVKYAPLHGVSVSEKWVSLAIDEFPILFIAAARARGVTTMRGLSELRHKESDRISGMISGLRRLGIEAFAKGDDVIITGGEFQSEEVHALGDHRIAMAFLIAGSVARGPVRVVDCESISTSFPSFVSKARQAGLLLR